jgi:hypothetical protein
MLYSFLKRQFIEEHHDDLIKENPNIVKIKIPYHEKYNFYLTFLDNQKRFHYIYLVPNKTFEVNEEKQLLHQQIQVPKWVPSYPLLIRSILYIQSLPKFNN